MLEHVLCKSDANVGDETDSGFDKSSAPS